jgi:WD40 repeat protein
MLARVKGHAEMITSLKFTPDCKRLISTSSDGCIFIWSIAPQLEKAMNERIEELKNQKNQLRIPKIHIPNHAQREFLQNDQFKEKYHSNINQRDQNQFNTPQSAPAKSEQQNQNCLISDRQINKLQSARNTNQNETKPIQTPIPTSETDIELKSNPE